jgi:uncharacterized protein (TIGR02996 family)
MGYNWFMSDEDALLAAIAAQPDEDTPRLAYADWLDENDRHARAEFIRVQIERARIPAAVPDTDQARHDELFAREGALLANHLREFLGPLAALPDLFEFRRGFVSEFDFSVHDFLGHAEFIAAMRPLPVVTVNLVVERLNDFLLCPHTGCVSRINAWSPHLTTLGLEYPDDLDMIDGIERLTRLEFLELDGCGINDLHLDLAYNYSLPSLAELDLSNNLITDEGVENLLRTDLPKQLRRLALRVNAITDLGAQWLAERWPTGNRDRLEHLAIGGNHLSWLGQRVLRERFGRRVEC